MKKYSTTVITTLILISLAFSANFAFAENKIYLEIQTPQNHYKFTENIPLEKYNNLGELTVELFNSFQIPYTGSIYGITSLYDISQDIDVISDTEMKAYGWCYSVNGTLSETMLNDFLIDPLLQKNEITLKWYYGYAHFKNGEWISQCTQ